MPCVVYQGALDVERQHVGQDLPGGVIVALAQQDGDERHRAHADQRAHRDGQVHQRESHGQAGDGGRAHPGDMADVGAVDHIVKRSRHLGDDARDGVLAQECADFPGPELSRSCTGRCHRDQGLSTISKSKRSGEYAGMAEEAEREPYPQVELKMAEPFSCGCIWSRAKAKPGMTEEEVELPETVISMSL